MFHIAKKRSLCKLGRSFFVIWPVPGNHAYRYVCVQVFEVNASSSRQGRRILAQLQEATQSHQVAQKKDIVVINLLPLTTSCEYWQPTGVYGGLGLSPSSQGSQSICVYGD